MDGMEGKKAAKAEAEIKLKRRGKREGAAAIVVRIDRSSSKGVVQQLKEALGSNAAKLVQVAGSPSSPRILSPSPLPSPPQPRPI